MARLDTPRPPRFQAPQPHAPRLIDLQALTASMAASGHAMPAAAPATAVSQRGAPAIGGATPKSAMKRGTGAEAPDAKGVETVDSDTSRAPMSQSGGRSPMSASGADARPPASAHPSPVSHSPLAPSLCPFSHTPLPHQHTPPPPHSLPSPVCVGAPHRALRRRRADWPADSGPASGQRPRWKRRRRRKRQQRRVHDVSDPSGTDRSHTQINVWHLSATTPAPTQRCQRDQHKSVNQLLVRRN